MSHKLPKPHIKSLLSVDEAEADQPDVDHVGLWDEHAGEVPAGRSYTDDV